MDFKNPTDMQNSWTEDVLVEYFYNIFLSHSLSATFKSPMNNSIPYYLFFSEKYNWGLKIMWEVWGLKKRATHQNQRTEKPTQTTLPKWMMCLFIKKKKVSKTFPTLREKS